MAAENPRNLPAPPLGTCPVCELADLVEPARHIRARYLCARCDLLFDGTFAEWFAMLPHRLARIEGRGLVATGAGVQAEWDPTR